MKTDILKSLKVLFVEDENNIATLLKTAIGNNFYSFNIATNGKDGISKFLEFSPDLVITDIMMPNLDGLQMAKELKKYNPNLPIIILSAYSDKDKLLDAIDIGIIKYFIKPFDPDELLNYIINMALKLENKTVTLKFGFTFSKTTNTLYKNNKFVLLTKRERKFLQLLINNHYILENIKIKTELWPNQNISDERLRTFIKRLRLKTSKELIINIKGQGYLLA